MPEADIRELVIPGVQKCLYEVLPHSVSLTRLIVKEDERGKGVGSHAVVAVLHMAKELGKREVILLLDPEEGRRSDLVRFYQGHGFHMLSDQNTMRCRL